MLIRWGGVQVPEGHKQYRAWILVIESLMEDFINILDKVQEV